MVYLAEIRIPTFDVTGLVPLGMCARSILFGESAFRYPGRRCKAHDDPPTHMQELVTRGENGQTGASEDDRSCRADLSTGALRAENHAESFHIPTIWFQGQ